MIEIERIEIVTPIQGRTGTVMAQRVETLNGRTSFIEPIDLKLGFDGTALPQEVRDALAAIDAQQQSTIVALTAERDQLQSQASTLTSERDSARAQRDQLASQVETLQAEINELRNPPTPQAVTPAQIRQWLRLRGIAREQINQFIAAIPDPLQRELAEIKWEYGVTVLRTDPLVAQFAAAIGLTEAQTDAAFEEASRL